MDIKEKNSYRNQWFSQIILPFIFCFLFFLFGVFLLTIKRPNGALNLRMAADISSIFLILLSFPLILFFFTFILLFIILVQKIIQINRSAFQKLLLIFHRAENRITTICNKSVQLFILLGSFLSINNKNKSKGFEHDVRKEK